MTKTNQKLDSNRPVRILSAPLGNLLKISFAMSAAAVAWACIAKVPWQVDGLAVVTPPGGISVVYPKADGTLIYIRNEQGRITSNEQGAKIIEKVQYFITSGGNEFYKNSQIYVNNPMTTINRLENLMNEYSSIVSMNYEGGEMLFGNRAVFKSESPYLKKGDIIAYIKNPTRRVSIMNKATDARSKLETLRRNMLSYRSQSNTYKKRLKKLEINYNNVAKYYELNKNFQETLKRLNTAGYVPKNTYISGIGSTANYISLGESYLQQGQQLTIELNNTENRMNEAINDIIKTITQLRNEINEYIEKSYLFMPQNGYLIEFSAVNQTLTNDRMPAFEYSDRPPELPEYTYAFFGTQQAAQVFPGMKILATPYGISRSQYGGIKGYVVSIDKNPASQGSINNVSGSSRIAKTFVENLQIPYRVLIKLEKNKDINLNQCQKNIKSNINITSMNAKKTLGLYSCYKWNSGAIPPFPVKLGNILSIQATTTEYTPLQLMIPKLRTFIGLETDAPVIKGNQK